MSSDRDPVLVTEERLQTFAEAVMLSTGLPPQDCRIVAHSLVEANLRGVDTHGVMRLPAYVERFSRIATEEICVVSETPSTAVVDGGNRPGQACAAFAMELAMAKAEQTGIGWVAVRRSNHFGAAAYFSMMAPPRGMIGLAASQASARIAPWGGTTPLLGNNPWSVAVPFRPDFPLVVDMATTVVTAGKIRQHAAAGRPLPPGWALDRSGRPTVDPHEALAGLLMPIGGHKGVGISLAVEWLTAFLAAGRLAPEIAPLDDREKPQGISHTLVAIHIPSFTSLESFIRQVEEQAALYRRTELAAGIEEVVMPGELEARTAKKRKKAGIPLMPSLIESLNRLAESRGCRERLFAE